MAGAGERALEEASLWSASASVERYPPLGTHLNGDVAVAGCRFASLSAALNLA
ncbi:hypothetical protein G5B40_02715 [Pikeienuella piscinae]|uniref:Uncharacterized protein n=1 Tax=Pikeienuella piscinae TaxID=2748098 RepID=A0A7L5BT61_9RHOB|nr:hypothetical protein [Pikeienuella piscinae]QIE54442.1 hypothetical protein G5B40_02715 [Pikeienuella piscinae]